MSVRPINLDLYVDGPDALPRGVDRTDPTRTPLRIEPFTADEVEMIRARELFVMRTSPHLYEPFLTESIHEARAETCALLGLYDWDCHTCGMATATSVLAAPCTWCGSRPSGKNPLL